MLDILGLDSVAERIYEELVTTGPGSGAGLAARTGVPEERIREAVALLARFGLITGQADLAEQYAAAPPSAALGALLARHRYALHQAELTVATLSEAYNSARADRTARDMVEIVAGAEAIRQRFEQIQMAATAELLAMADTRREVVALGDGMAGNDALRRGVTYRLVLEHAVLRAPSTAEAVAGHLSHQHCRVVEAVPAKLVIADRAYALVPLSDGLPADGSGDPVAMAVRAPGMIKLLADLFESVWERAVPVRVTASGEVEPAPVTARQPTELDLRILSLLMVGSTDAAIANQLGLGLRTVQRRVARMMELAGVSTRLQLGWQACSRAWLG